MSRIRKVALIYLLVTALFSAACFKSKIVAKRIPGSPLPAGAKNLRVDGVTYALPRTVIKVNVPVEMTVETPGVLERLAPCFLSEEVASQRVKERSRSFSIEQTTFATRGEPDPDEHFIVKTKGGYFEHKSMLLEYAPNGVLTKAEAESKDESLEFAVAAAKTVISVGARAATGATLVFGGMPPAEALRVGIQSCRAQIAATKASEAVAEVKAAAQAAPGAGAYIAPAEAAASAARIDAARSVREFTDFMSGINSSAATAEKAAERAADNAIVHALAAQGPTASAAAAALAAGANNEAAAATRAANALSEMMLEVGAPNPLVLCPFPPVPPPCALAGTPSPRFANDYAKAADVNDAIKRLQGQRENLASGGSGGGFPSGPIAPDTLKLMLKETDDTIEAYQNSYFLGVTIERSWTGAFEFTPPAAGPAPPPAAFFTSPTFFYFDVKQGLCEGPAADAQGIKIPEKFRPKGGCAVVPASAVPVAVRVNRALDDDGFLSNLNVAHLADEARERDRGFYYRVPAKGVALLQAGAKNLSQSDVIVAQFGIIASLPASSSGRTTQYTVALNESTGALQNFKLGSDSLLQKSLLDDAAAAANSAIDAKKANEKKKAETSDELAQKKRELELLKTQNEINDEKKKLEGSRPPQ